MRIAHITTSPPNIDAIGNYAIHITEKLKAAGHEVDIWDPSKLGLIKMVNAARRSRPDIIHVQYYGGKYGFSFYIFLFLMRLLGMKFSIDLHEPLSRTLKDVKKVYGPFSFFVRPLLGFLERRLVYGLSSCIFVHSEKIKEGVERYVGRIAELPYYGGEEIWTWDAIKKERDAFKEGAGVEAVIAYAGFVVPRKNVLFTVEAAGKLSKKMKVLFMIVGGKAGKEFKQHKEYGGYYDNVIKRLEELGLKYKVTGLLEEKEFLEKLKLCDVMLAPFENVAQSSTLFSAMMCGVPIVASRDEGLLLVEKEGIGFNVRLDVDEFVRVMENLLKDNSLYENKAKRCISLIKGKYNWARLVEIMIKEFNDLKEV